MKLLIPLMLLLTSCASYTPGEYSEIEKTDSKEVLLASANIDETMSFGDLILVNFYFKNPSQNWLRVKNVEVVDIENHPDVRVIIGKDLYYWARSMEHKIAVDNHNRELLVGSLAMAGVALSIAGSTSRSMTTAGVGAALAVGVVTLDAAENLLEAVSTAERASLVPESHLYSPFVIPPNLVTRKWVLFQKMNTQRMCRLKFKVNYIDGTSAIYNNELSRIRKICGENAKE